ncbi:glycosyltransferase family 39 protein [Flavobacterium sp. W22_SRS_FP1]|uniref:glycosyltransferase family 39 protein n=1 Tax=Flavobacterium sp. W22_SRS_FP1 TaxID=3240276 RepID=UPI003F8F94DB
MQNKQNFILLMLLFCYGLLGLIHSNNQGFWHDEIYTLTFLKGISAYTFDGNTLSSFTNAFPIQYCKDILQKDNFLSNFHIQILHEGHPPLYFLFLKVWANIFGYTELALRSFSLISGLLAIKVFFSILKDNFKSKFTIWIILILVLFNPFLFYYFTEARMYAFAFLLAMLCFKYWLKYREHKILKSFDFICFMIASVALLYTHYYGVFFLVALGYYEVIKNGPTFKLLNYSIPIILFLPWTFIIKLQTEFHNIHWTDGSFSLFDSSIGFGKGLISLFFSPMSDAKNYETVFGIVISLILLYWIASTWKQRIIYLSVGFLYFFQIFLFDKVLNHHTIIVARYYIFILIFFYWAIAKVIENYPKKNIIFFTFAYCIISGVAFYQIYTLSLAPKQMYKELASYIDSKHDSKNTIIVVEPGGPIIWGLSYYLKNDFNIISAKYFKPKNTSKNIIYIDEMLGDKYWENHLNSENQKKLKLVPFVGVFLYE